MNLSTPNTPNTQPIIHDVRTSRMYHCFSEVPSNYKQTSTFLKMLSVFWLAVRWCGCSWQTSPRTNQNTAQESVLSVVSMLCALCIVYSIHCITCIWVLKACEMNVGERYRQHDHSRWLSSSSFHCIYGNEVGFFSVHCQCHSNNGNTAKKIVFLQIIDYVRRDKIYDRNQNN